MKAENVPLEYVKFAVVDRAVCVWGPDVSETNRRFLRNIDPGFFLYQAKVHASALASPQFAQGAAAQYPALALRIAYGMAVEAFCALAGALIQAPNCVFGWLSTYNNTELRELATRLSSGASLRALPPFRPATWEHLATLSLSPVFETDADRAAKVRDRFVSAWKRFGSDLISEAASQEYNSLKHGFRVEPTPLKLRLSSEEGDSLIESDAAFGHSFPFLARMSERDRRHHFDIGRALVSLEPAAQAAALEILTCSLHNLAATARAFIGDTEDNAIIFPDDDTFEASAARTTPITRFAHSGRVRVSSAEYWTAEEILSIYE